MTLVAAIRTLTLLVLTCISSVAHAEEIRVFSTGAPSAAAKAIGAKFSGDTGDRLNFTVEQPAALQQRLAAGEQADVVILPAPVIAKLNSAGSLRADSTVDLARVAIGVVIRDGAKRPDISSVSAIRQLLLDARAIVYPDPRSGGGTAGRAIAHMIDRMGITKAVENKLTRKSAIGGGVVLVAEGKAEVGLFNISEIMPIKGVTLVGPLPAEVQNYIVFAAAIPENDPAPKLAAAFIKRLADPEARQAWQDAGLEPVAKAP
jgi:molybdate transport system substrate-binding protein